MNKKILVSLSVIAAVAAIAIGGTVAYFSDVETSPGNTFTAGTIDLAVNDKNPLDTAVVTITDAKPSEKIEPIAVKLSNVGTNAGVVDLHIVPGTPSEGIDSEPECAAECGTSAAWDNSAKKCDRTSYSCWQENICTIIDYDYCYDNNDNGVCDEGDMKGYFQPSDRIILGQLDKGENTRWLWLSYHLRDTGVPQNEYQGDTCTFDIEFSLEQIRENQLPLRDDAGHVNGWVWYGPAASVNMSVYAGGLIPGCYQITLEGKGVCTGTDKNLAAGVEGHTANFDAGYYKGGGYTGGLLNDCDSSTGWGVYNPNYAMVDSMGNLSTNFIIKTDGNYPSLPTGDYKDVRMVVKQINAGQVGCPGLGQAPVWNCGKAGTDCYIGKLWTGYDINFSL